MKKKDRCLGPGIFVGKYMKLLLQIAPNCNKKKLLNCKNKAALPHVCPFQSEINDDQTECNCCEECKASCADEI